MWMEKRDTSTLGVTNLMNGASACVNAEGMLSPESTPCLTQRGRCVVFRKTKLGGEEVVVVVVGDNNGLDSPI